MVLTIPATLLFVGSSDGTYMMKLKSQWGLLLPVGAPQQLNRGLQKGLCKNVESLITCKR